MSKLLACILLVSMAFGQPIPIPPSVLGPINQAIPPTVTQMVPIPVTSVQQTVQPGSNLPSCTVSGTASNTTTVQTQNVTITNITTTATGQTVVTGFIGQVTQTTGFDASGCGAPGQTGTIVTTATNVPFQVVGTTTPTVDPATGAVVFSNFMVMNATADVLAGNPTTAVNGLSGSFGQLNGQLGGLANATLGPAVSTTVGGVVSSNFPPFQCANLNPSSSANPNCTVVPSNTTTAPMATTTTTTGPMSSTTMMNSSSTQAGTTSPTIPNVNPPNRCGCPKFLSNFSAQTTCADFQCRIMSAPDQYDWRDFRYANCVVDATAAGSCSCPTTATESVAPCLCCQIQNAEQCRKTAVPINDKESECCSWRNNACHNPRQLSSCANVATVSPTTEQPVQLTTAPTYGILMEASVMCSVAISGGNSAANAVARYIPSTAEQFCNLNWAFSIGRQGGWGGLAASGSYSSALANTNPCVPTNGNASVDVSFVLWFSRLSASQLQTLKNGIDQLKTNYNQLVVYYNSVNVSLQSCQVKNFSCFDWTNNQQASAPNTGACAVLGVIGDAPPRQGLAVVWIGLIATILALMV